MPNILNLGQIGRKNLQNQIKILNRSSRIWLLSMSCESSISFRGYYRGKPNVLIKLCSFGIENDKN